MKSLLQLRSLLFGRGTAGGVPGSIPIRADACAAVPPVDSLRSGAQITSGAVAFPVARGSTTELPLTAVIDVLAPAPGPLFVRAVPRGEGLLGRVPPTPLPIASAMASLEMPLKLQGHRLAQAKVGEHKVGWTWQHSEDGASWVTFDETTHTVFTLLHHPAPPWGGPDDPQTVVPWMEILETAARWSKGASDEDGAMDRITAGVSGLGGKVIDGEVLDYKGGSSSTSENIFFISYFMRVVKRAPGAPGSFNCQDLASAVAVFAAVLGCPARITGLLPEHVDCADRLQTNRIRLFGTPTGSIESFKFHEVASLDRGGHRAVSDACVAVDFDRRPAVNPPGKFRFPTGIQFSDEREPGGIGYRRRLLLPSHQGCRIELFGGDGIRYPDDVPAGVPRRASESEDMRRLCFLEELRGIPWSRETSPGAHSAFDIWLADAARAAPPNGFRRRVLSGSEVLEFTPIGRSADAALGAAEVSVLRLATRDDAVDVLLKLLVSYVHSLQRCRSLGDFATYGERDDVMYLLRGQVLAQMHGRRGGLESAFNAAQQLDQQLLGFFAPL